MATDEVDPPSRELAKCENVEFEEEERKTTFADFKAVMQGLQEFLPNQCWDDAYHLVDRVSASPDNITLALSFFSGLLQHLQSEKEKVEKAKKSSSTWLSKTSFSKTVKVYPLVTGQTFDAHKVILDNAMNVGWLTSATTKIEITTDLREAHIVVVFCPITSRVGSDVEITMRKVRETMGPRRVVLVLLHHTRDEDFSTDKTNWSQAFPNVVSSLHVLFHETQNGLLNCQRNKDAMAQMQKILLKQYK